MKDKYLPERELYLDNNGVLDSDFLFIFFSRQKSDFGRLKCGLILCPEFARPIEAENEAAELHVKHTCAAWICS